MFLALCLAQGAHADRAPTDAQGYTDDAFEAFRIRSASPVQSYSEHLNVSYRPPGLDPNLNIPFIKARSKKEPEANFNFGPFHLDLLHWNNTLVASNNINRVDSGAESDIIAASILNMRLTTEIASFFNFTLNGSAVWLPFENRVGISGFGLVAPSLEVTPIFDATAKYENTLGRWDMELLNSTNISSYDVFSTTVEGRSAIWQPLEFDSIDRAGNYSLGPSEQTRQSFSDNLTAGTDTDNVRITNLTGLTLSRWIPTQSKLSVSTYHREYFYPTQDVPQGIRYSEGVTVKVTNQRENMRFKPFAIYKVQRSNILYRGELFRAGIRGPITDYTSLVASTGYSKLTPREDSVTSSKQIYRLAITNDLTPTLTHSFGVERVPRESGTESVTTTWFYELYKIINGNLTYAFRLDNNETETDNKKGDTRRQSSSLRQSLAYNMGDRGSFTINNLIQSNEADALNTFTRDRFQLTFSYNRQLSDDTTLNTSYRYTKSESSQVISSFTESLVYVNLKKAL